MKHSSNMAAFLVLMLIGALAYFIWHAFADGMARNAVCTIFPICPPQQVETIEKVEIK